jgi:hypothetical protein
MTLPAAIGNLKMTIPSMTEKMTYLRKKVQVRTYAEEEIADLQICRFGGPK